MCTLVPPASLRKVYHFPWELVNVRRWCMTPSWEFFQRHESTESSGYIINRDSLKVYYIKVSNAYTQYLRKKLIVSLILNTYLIPYTTLYIDVLKTFHVF